LHGGLGEINFKKIMIATDGSDCSVLAANRGIELARLSGGTVYAVHVVPTAYLFPMDGDYFSSMGVNPYWEPMYETMYGALNKQGQQTVDSVKGLGEAKGIKVEPILLEGHPAEELIRYAEEQGMDIVIMGTHGKKGLDRLILGSVAENLVRHSKVPIMVVGGKCKS
jgi:nucleotide-binding universal stress UspA family protein